MNNKYEITISDLNIHEHKRFAEKKMIMNVTIVSFGWSHCLFRNRQKKYVSINLPQDSSKKSSAQQVPHTMYDTIKTKDKLNPSFDGTHYDARSAASERRAVTFFPGSHCTHTDTITIAAIGKRASRSPSHHHTITIRSPYDPPNDKKRQSEPGISAGDYE